MNMADTNISFVPHPSMLLGDDDNLGTQIVEAFPRAELGNWTDPHHGGRSHENTDVILCFRYNTEDDTPAEAMARGIDLATGWLASFDRVEHVIDGPYIYFHCE